MLTVTFKQSYLFIFLHICLTLNILQISYKIMHDLTLMDLFRSYIYHIKFPVQISVNIIYFLAIMRSSGFACYFIGFLEIEILILKHAPFHDVL